MKHVYARNEESLQFRLRLKIILLFLILLVLGTAAQAQCPTPPGNPTVYGADIWNCYVYSGLDTNNPPQNAFAASMTYQGYYTLAEQFNYDIVNGSLSGSNICGSYSDLMAVRSRMTKTFTPGYYNVTIGGDDGVRLSIDGGATWVISDWNYHSYQTSSAVLYLSGSVNLVMESYDQGGQYHTSFAYTSCSNPSTAPTGITASVNPVCANASTTLTATGGNLGTNGSYQWGTGTVGSNIIAGQTAASITVAPGTTTTYWVRRVDTGTCAQNTAGVTLQVTVSPTATAPTSISGNTSLCLGASTTLTATGGTTATGSTYEWGTGSVVGSNVLSGQTAASITVTPTADTTYWVRRVNANASCGTTSGVTVTVTVSSPPGDQVTYGSGSWIGYVYATWTSAATAFSATYRGYVTQTETFDQNLATASISGPNVCGSYANQFAIRFKMTKNMTAGNYTFTVGGDDGYRLSVDGGSTWLINNWTDHSYATTTSVVTYLSGNVNFVLEYYENSTDSRVSFAYTACGATAPTSLTADTTCSSSGTNLYANGGTGSTYQWGTGTAPNNVISGQTNASMWVNPSVATTYWVRRYDSVCNFYTAAQSITIYPVGTGPWGLSASSSTVCANTTVTLTANPGTLPTGSSYQWSYGASAGATVLGTSTANTYNVTVTANTTYWVRIINGGGCPAGAAQSTTVNLYSLSTAPTSITGDNGLCSVNGINLYANGGTSASNAQYEWGTGSTIGSNSLGLTSGNSLYVNPTATTVYWVRRYDSSCNYYTTGVTVTVYKGSTGPWNISGPGTICAGTSVTLTADGAPGAGTYQWGTGASGSNIISGATTNTITFAAPATTTTYWVRILGAGTCGNSGYVTYNVQVYTTSTAPTSISGSSTLCGGAGQNLTANGVTFGNGGGQYQWGTGTVSNANAIANSNSQTLWVQPSVPTTYWVRAYDSTCGTYSAAVSFSVNVSSTAPTGITGTTTICSGSSTSITATGGYLSSIGSYEWGTGGTAGSNVISGTAATISLNPTTTTSYWVRRKDAAPCNSSTSAYFFTVTVNTPSTAPTSITGAPATSCAGSSITMTATGGSGSTTFQWGTGSTAGSNIISGQTASTYTVVPSATTTYWVRRVDASPCTPTAAAFFTVTIAAAPGTPATFGANQWNVYGYNGADITLASTTYQGYYVQNTLSPNSQDTANNGWATAASPSASAGWNGCTVNNDNHTFVYKRQGFPCGTYSLTMNNWDDVLQVYLNGSLIYSQAAWSGGNVTSLIGSYNLDATSQIEIRVRENGGNSTMAMTITKTDTAPTAPTSVSPAASTICPGGSTTLTATGGVVGTNGVYQWGTGSTAGSNILGTSTTATYTVTPSATTTYWVRCMETLCSATTSGVFTTVAVSAGSVAGTLTNPNTTICRGTTPASAITLGGQTGSVIKWQYANDAAFTSGVTDIANTTATLTSAQMGAISQTRYFRAVIQNGSCTVAYTAATAILVGATVTYNGSWSDTPSAVTPVVINSNLSLNSNLTVCACEVANNAVVTINNNANLIVRREVKVNTGSSFIIEDKGSLVQIDDDAIDIGSITVKRNTTPMRTYDYTYWSSPVSGWTLNALSPNTLSDKYYAFNPTIGNWSTIAGGAAAMTPGVGYIIRAPQGWSLTNASNGVYSGQFQGVPNNGVINTPILKSTSAFNLIGNPYPSAIDIDLFITNAANQGAVNGTIYLWTHNTPLNPAGGTYTYTTNDYAKYNLTGGVKTASAAITGGAEPTGKVASGQGFFIEAKTSLANGTYSAVFNNSMRVTGSNNQFYRMAAESDESGDAAADSAPATGVSLEKHRYWLNISNAAYAYDQTLIGYIENATNDKDQLFDGTTMPAGNAVSLYTTLGTDKLAIQGRALPFDQNDVVPLGYRVNMAGDFTITLEHFDGLFDNQDVYLLDKTDNSYHNLKEAAYTFSSVTGTFESRFEIHYVSNALGTDDQTKAENDVIVIKNGDHIEISSGNLNMEKVTLFDVTGKRIYQSDDINDNLFTSNDLMIATQVIIVKVELQDGITISKKVRF